MFPQRREGGGAVGAGPGRAKAVQGSGLCLLLPSGAAAVGGRPDAARVGNPSERGGFLLLKHTRGVSSSKHCPGILIPSRGAWDLVAEACDPCGLARGCSGRAFTVPSVLRTAAAHRRCLPARAAPGAGLRQVGAAGRETSLTAAGLACALGGLQASSLQGAWSAVECLVLPGTVFVFVVMAWEWLVGFCVVSFPFYYFFSFAASMLLPFPTLLSV